MKDQTSPNDVFRFIHLNQKRVDDVPSIGPKETKLYSTIDRLGDPGERMHYAHKVLAEHRDNIDIREPGDLRLGAAFTEALGKVREIPEATVKTFLSQLYAYLPHGYPAEPSGLYGHPHYKSDLLRLSDTLLLCGLARKLKPADLPLFRKLYNAYLIIERVQADPSLMESPVGPYLSVIFKLPSEWEERTDPNGEEWEVIKSVGVADLLVVKRQVIRYEETEIAHIENIMPGEERSREHRHLERLEDQITIEKESTSEKEKELETAERFELNREASRTIKEDQKYGFDLSISGKYGPVVEFSSEASIDVSRSEETTAKSSSEYAKDVVQRSMERIEERVYEQRIRKVIKETEETNLHSFHNEGGDYVSGIYQFVDKIYKAQVFNYGKRQMFDLMIPEPASYLWFLESSPAKDEPALPKPPNPLKMSPLEIKYGAEDRNHEWHYTRLATLYGANGLTPPPEDRVLVNKNFRSPKDDSTPAREEGNTPYSMQEIEIRIPEGYKVVRADANTMMFTDHSEAMGAFSFQKLNKVLDPPNDESSDYVHIVQGGFRYLKKNMEFTEVELRDILPTTEGGSVYFNVLAFESANFTVNLQITCAVTERAIEEWQLETYDKIQSAYRDQMLTYQDEMARIQAEKASRLEKREVGVPPGKKQQILVTELKKHCISVFTRQWYDRFSALRVTGSTSPPTFDLHMARDQGSYIRFFEQAFEWHQMQYAFYPYFWANKERWGDRFLRDDSDYDYQQFLQAGAARVVLAVRPGFEEAVSYFMETGLIWNGEGEPPTIGDPLYLSIVDEIRERSEDLRQAIPVGQPWEVRMPTNLVKLRNVPSLPKWEEDPEGSWNWSPSEES